MEWPSQPLPETLADRVRAALAELHWKDVEITGASGVSGSSFHRVMRIDTTLGDYFLKYNTRATFPQFSAEAIGLEALEQTRTLATPKLVGAGMSGDYSYLLLVFIKPAPRAPTYWQQLGEGLAALHQHTQAHFGAVSDNFIGTLPQENTPTKSFANFFWNCRIQPLLARLEQAVSPTLRSRFDRLQPQLASLFPPAKPALLHGDLWQGNLLVNHAGSPLVIDPAVYYGHPEQELAFLRLFGGIDRSVEAAYQATNPLAPGFEERVDLYNLYPLLVHANLFGPSYLTEVEATLQRFT